MIETSDPNDLTLEDLADGRISPDELELILQGVSLADILKELGVPWSRFEKILPKLKPKTLNKAFSQHCQTDFLAFMDHELGMDIAPHHRVWNELLKTGDDCCILAPRDHGKSLLAARAYTIWKAKYDPFVREIYVLGADQESAVENLDKIKELLLTRRTLVGLVPTNWQQGFNNRTSLRMTNGTIIRAKSFFSKLRGRHPQLIILDDVLNESNSDSELKRRKISEQFSAVVVPMKDKGSSRQRAKGYRGQITTIGTAMAPDDLYHEQIESKVYQGVKQSAILVDANWDPILDAGGSRQALWADRYTVADLDEIKEKIGSILFEREYQNKPLVDEAAIFPPSLFRPLFDDSRSYVAGYTGTNNTFLGVDFSVPGNTDGDWTVLMILELTPERLWVPLNYWRARPGSMGEQLQQIEYMAQVYKVSKGYLEDNVFQKVYAQEFAAKSNLPMEGHTVTSAKNSYVEGILGLRPLLESGAWRFPYKTKRDRAMTDLLVREFAGIVQRGGKLGNESSHDDIVLALWHAWRAGMDLMGPTSWSVDWGWRPR